MLPCQIKNVVQILAQLLNYSHSYATSSETGTKMTFRTRVLRCDVAIVVFDLGMLGFSLRVNVAIQCYSVD